MDNRTVALQLAPLQSSRKLWPPAILVLFESLLCDSNYLLGKAAKVFGQA